MPYTPPSQRSPATSKPSSPTLSRAQSYVNDSVLSSPIAASRPSLPRSISSTSYLNKHRRSPSITQNDSQNSTASQPGPGDKKASPNGAISTPPDSASDDEERGRQLGSLAELQEALQSIQQRRGASPERGGDGSADKPAVAPSPSSSTMRPALTAEARKISHSRSSSEIQLSSLAPNMSQSPEQTSESSDDEDELRIKPPLVRKKSGELVKPALRPSSRRRPSSMPGTPTFSKAVHFNDNIEQVRHFLQVDRPIAVSAGSSPVETYDSDMEYPFDSEGSYSSRKVEWEIKLANFPKDSPDRQAMPVYVEKISLASDNKTLVGSVAVANIAFHKLVVARFTLDYWKTTSEVVAEYNNDVRKKPSQDGYDRFNFNIKLADQANLERKTLLLCVRYNVNGQEFWDNNNNMNFQVDFTKKKPASKRQSRTSSGGSIPRSKHSPPSGSRTKPFSGTFEDDFSNGLDPKLLAPSHTIRLRSKPGRSNLSESSGVRSTKQSTSLAFSTRYDFGASLSAALNTAQTALGDRSGISFKDAKNNVSLAQKAASAPETPSGPRPDALSSEKPDLKSAEYNELIQKFCFFGTVSSKSASPVATSPAKVDGESGTVGTRSEHISGSSTPTPPRDLSPLMDGANDSKAHSNSMKNSAHFLSRSTSPGPLTGSGFPERTRSSMNFGYPFHGMHGGILGESHGPQPILG